MPKEVPRAGAIYMFKKEDLVFAYTRKEAIEDGQQALANPEICREAGIRYPVYVTAVVHDRYIGFHPDLKGQQNREGRLGDILAMFRFAARSAQMDILSFTFVSMIPKE
jgi:hypothetical protein